MNSNIFEGLLRRLLMRISWKGNTKNWRILVLVPLVCIAYIPTFTGEFILDDKFLVRDNSYIKEFHTLKSYLNQEDGIYNKNDLGSYHTGYYRPLMNLFYFFDYKIWGMSASGFRVTNVFLHLLCCIILFRVINLLLNDHEAAFWTAVLFSIHPLNTESVSFILARNNIVVTIFILLSFFYYVDSMERKSHIAYFLSLISFTGAVFSKEFGVMVFPVFFLHNRLLSKRNNNIIRELISYIPFILLLILYFYLRRNVVGDFLTPIDSEQLLVRIYFVPYLMMWNLKLIFLPYALHTFSVTYPTSLLSWQAIVSIVLMIIIMCKLWMMRENKILIFSTISFLIFLFPILNIILSSAVSLISMRWLYLPMAIIMLSVACLIKKTIVVKREIVISCICIGVIYMGVYSFFLNKTLWHNEDTFFSQEVLHFKNNYYAGGFAEKLLSKQRYKEAEKYFIIAINEYPENASSYLNYSSLLVKTVRAVEAVSLLDRAKKLSMIHEEQGQWYNNMGTALFMLGQREKALENFEKAVTLAPANALFWTNLGGVYGTMGNYEKAVEVFKRGLNVIPESMQLRINLALTYINMGEHDRAIGILEKIPPEIRESDVDVMRLMKKAYEGL
jgi:Tfp pilus assembly protein PilF